MLLCRPSAWRSAPGPGFTAANIDSHIPSEIRKDAYKRAVYHSVEMNVDESVKGAIIRAAEQDMRHSHSISEAIITCLGRFSVLRALPIPQTSEMPFRNFQDD